MSEELKQCCVDDCCKGSKRGDRYCSMHRSRLSRTGSLDKKTPSQKFMEKCEPVTESGCWIWTGTLHNSGYGRISLTGRKELAHRHSFRLFRGELAVGMQVNHKCDNPLCVNPDHLYAGTQKQNVRDCIDRGRFKGVENSPFVEGNQYARK
jgi:hypothetical protein